MFLAECITSVKGSGFGNQAVEKESYYRDINAFRRFLWVNVFTFEMRMEAFDCGRKMGLIMRPVQMLIPGISLSKYHLWQP